MKTGFWLKGGKGKLAGATVYKQNGETVMREIVTPANPKTTAQLLQRIIMHTVMQSYSKMKAITDHSFEGIKAGRDTMSYYMKQNVQFAREKVAEQQAQGIEAYEMYNYVPLGRKGFTPNQYQVAMGSLPQITTDIPDLAGQHNPYVSGFAANTYQNVIDTLGLKRGDQLTFLIVKDIQSSTQFGANEFEYCRVILDPTDSDGNALPLSTEFITVDGINAPSPRNEGSMNFVYRTNGQLQFRPSDLKDVIAAAVIASRQGSDGNWLRSTTYLTYVPGYGQVYDLGTCLDLAASGNTTPVYTSNSLYLNNAGQGTGSSVPVSDGGNTDNEPTVNSVTVNGVSLVSGTQGSILLANGTELPATLPVVVNADNADGLSAAVMNGNTRVAEANFVNGVASISASLNSGITYAIKWADADEFHDTAFTFTVAVNSQEGGGGDDYGV